MIKEITKIFNFVNPKLSRVFIPFILKNPKYLKNANKLMKNFDKAETTREKILKEEGVMVPPILILSITHIRENGEMLENVEGPCALYEHQKELEELRKKVGAYRTGV